MDKEIFNKFEEMVAHSSHNEICEYISNCKSINELTNFKVYLTKMYPELQPSYEKGLIIRRIHQLKLEEEATTKLEKKEKKINKYQDMILNLHYMELHEWVAKCNDIKELNNLYKEIMNNSFSNDKERKLSNICSFIIYRTEELKDFKNIRPVAIESEKIKQININPFMIMWFKLKELLSECDDYETETIFEKMRELEIESSYPYWKVNISYEED